MEDKEPKEQVEETEDQQIQREVDAAVKKYWDLLNKK